MFPKETIGSHQNKGYNKKRKKSTKKELIDFK